MSSSSPPSAGGDLVPAFAVGVLSVIVVLATQAAIGPRSSVGDHPAVPLLTGLAFAFAAGIGTRSPASALGIAAMVGFPVWAIGDLVLHPGPHEGPEHGLLPIELLLYGGYMVLGYVAALLGRRLGRARRPAA